MNRYIIFSDSHINEKNIKELAPTFKEILSYIDKNTIVVCCGDYYDKKNLSPLEVEFGTEVALKILNSAKEFIITIGNHTLYSKNKYEVLSSVNYLSFLGIKIISRYFKDNMFFAHSFTDKSLDYYGKEQCLKTKDLLKYKYTFLGHQHRFQQIYNKIFHVGSIIYTSFSEEGEDKYISKIEDNKLDFIKLTTPIPIKTIKNLDELNKINPHYKVRLIIEDYNYLLKIASKLKELSNTYYQFKVKYDIKKDSNKITANKQDVKITIKNWLNSLEPNIQKELKEELNKYNLV